LSPSKPLISTSSRAVKDIFWDLQFGESQGQCGEQPSDI
jgi:hypothetical protein